MRFLKNIGVFLFLLLTFFINHYALCAELPWQKRECSHFIIYYRKEVPEDYIEQVATKIEEYYTSISANLGFNVYEFWLWEKRAKIYIFKDAAEYQKESEQPGWSGGAVSLRHKIIKAYPWNEGFFDKLLPHEIGHLMFHEFVGFKNNIPLWLDEGVAISQEKSDIKNYSVMMKGLRVSLPFNKLHNISTKTLVVPEIFYVQSASIVDYLLTQFGKDAFFKFCNSLKNGQTVEEAISSSYHFRDLKQFNEAWLEYLRHLGDDQ